MKAKEIKERICWMIKVKNCKSICLFCKFYPKCKKEGEEGERRMNLKYAIRGEDTEQIRVIQWSRNNMSEHPELKWLYHCPNGGSRNKAEAGKLKQMGVKAGVSDLCLPYPKGIYCGLFVEMKYGEGRQQPSQRQFLRDMEEAGHFVVTCYSAKKAIEAIEEYLNLNDCFKGGRTAIAREYRRMPLGEVRMHIENNSILKGSDDQ